MSPDPRGRDPGPGPRSRYPDLSLIHIGFDAGSRRIRPSEWAHIGYPGAGPLCPNSPKCIKGLNDCINDLGLNSLSGEAPGKG